MCVWIHLWTSPCFAHGVAEQEERDVNRAWWSVDLRVSVPCRWRWTISLCDKSQRAGVRPRISGTSGARSGSQSAGGGKRYRYKVIYNLYSAHKETFKFALKLKQKTVIKAIFVRKDKLAFLKKVSEVSVKNTTVVSSHGHISSLWAMCHPDFHQWRIRSAVEFIQGDLLILENS